MWPTQKDANTPKYDYLRVLSESYPMNTNMIGFRWFSKKLRTLVLWTKVASALEGLCVEDFPRMYVRPVLYKLRFLSFCMYTYTHCSLSIFIYILVPLLTCPSFHTNIHTIVIYLFLHLGDQRDSWRKAQVSLPSVANYRSSFKLVFEATRGVSFMGDISIDDIKVKKELCLDPGMYILLQHFTLTLSS